jgi:hypothetical protein
MTSSSESDRDVICDGTYLRTWEQARRRHAPGNPLSCACSCDNPPLPPVLLLPALRLGRAARGLLWPLLASGAALRPPAHPGAGRGLMRHAPWACLLLQRAKSQRPGASSTWALSVDPSRPPLPLPLPSSCSSSRSKPTSASDPTNNGQWAHHGPLKAPQTQARPSGAASIAAHRAAAVRARRPAPLPFSSGSLGCSLRHHQPARPPVVSYVCISYAACARPPPPAARH